MTTRDRAAWFGLGATLLLVVVAFALPPLTGWEVASRAPRSAVGQPVPPLHGWWEPKVGPGTVPALLLALLGWRYAAGLAGRLRWPWLLAAAYVTGLAWLLSLALVDGPAGLSRVLGNPYEYLRAAREVEDVGALLSGYVDRIPKQAPDNWPTHVAGHPPGALLFFVGLVRLGLGGDLAAGVVVTALAATIAPAVLVTLRALGAEDAARRAAPFLVLTPAAVFLAVSADAVFTVVTAWGLACLALAATAPRRRRGVGWAVAAGLLLGYGVLLSYGLVLMGVLALAVLVLGRAWWPLPVAAGAALVVALGFAAAGFVWWEAIGVLRERYWDGVAAQRPAAYWLWAGLGALAVAAGPMVGAGLAHAAAAARGVDRRVLVLTAAAAATVLLADLSLMSKAEVERIWLPFVPWLTLGLALLPPRWRRAGLAVQLATALLVQHLLYTTW